MMMNCAASVTTR